MFAARRLLQGGGSPPHLMLGIQDFNGASHTFTFPDVPPGDVFLAAGAAFFGPNMGPDGGSPTAYNQNLSQNGSNVGLRLGFVAGHAGGDLDVYVSGNTRVMIGAIWLPAGLISMPHVDAGFNGGALTTRSTGNVTGASVMLGGSYSAENAPEFTDVDEYVSAVGSSQGLAVGIIDNPTNPDVMTSTNSRVIIGGAYT
jgi:hypothetical protein